MRKRKLSPPVELSIVATLYRSAPHLVEFCRRSAEVAARVAPRWELILVDDGSPDESLSLALSLRGEIPQLRVMELARNYGHYRALLVGMRAARGERVFLVDCDLEEPPEILVDFWRELEEQPEIDAVVGVQDRRKGGWVERTTGSLFYRALRFTSGLALPRDTTVARLLRRPYVEALARHRELPWSFDVLSDVVGFRQATIPVSKASRPGTTYDLGRKLTIALPSLLAYSARPFWLIAGVGAGVLIATLVCFSGLYAVAGSMDMWNAAVLFSVWIATGVLLGTLGLIGVLATLILAELRSRPVIVRRVFPDPDDHEQGTER